MKTLTTISLLLLLTICVVTVCEAGDDGRQCNKTKPPAGTNQQCSIANNHTIKYFGYTICGWAIKNEHCKNDKTCITKTTFTFTTDGDGCDVLAGPGAYAQTSCCAGFISQRQ